MKQFSDEIQTELRLRGCTDVDMPKAQLIAKLKSILEGVQRVPSLLLSCPTSELKQFNLQRYSILPCEPLHDLKGHLNNLLPRGYILVTLVVILMKQFSMSVCMMKVNMVLNSKNMSSNLKYI